jgi:hypothetical protein
MIHVATFASTGVGLGHALCWRTTEGVVRVPPHCDSLDGPVVKAAGEALAAGDVDLILPFVPADDEADLRDAFDLVLKARAAGGEAAAVADRWFFETAVRVHRAGEGAPFTGLKPSGLDVGPAIPAAERALVTGSPTELTDLLCASLRHQVEHRLAHVMELKPPAGATVAAAREYVEAMLGLEVWSHQVYRQLLAAPHEHAGAHGTG